MSEDVLEEEDEDVLLRVKVSPNSRKFGIGKINQWRNHLEISLSSEPKRGEANRELLDELETKLEKNVSLVRGSKSREKLLKLEGISRKEVVRLLGLEELLED